MYLISITQQLMVGSVLMSFTDDTHWPDDADVDDGSTRRKHSQHTDQTTEVGRSKFYIRHSRLDTGTESDSEREKDDGSSTEEFETAEFGKVLRNCLCLQIDYRP